MTTKQAAYDNPVYLARWGSGPVEAGGGATTQYGKFAAFTALQAYSAQLTVTTAGTAAGHGFSIIKISGTATSTLATSTLGTGAAGTTANVTLSTAAGGAALLQGDVIAALSLSDATGKAAITFELGVSPNANVTA
jgi:hypothetical protein